MKSLTNEQARSANSLGKKTEDHFILDFFNRKDGSINSFDPFYSATSLSEATNINVLPELNMALDEIGDYEWREAWNSTQNIFIKLLLRS